MIRWVLKLNNYIGWLIEGKPYIDYEGYHCGCCGKWTARKFKIPKYQSHGKWGDTWGLCKQCESPENTYIPEDCHMPQTKTIIKNGVEKKVLKEIPVTDTINMKHQSLHEILQEEMKGKKNDRSNS